jgi:uncharacterized membrane protein YvbJ
MSRRFCPECGHENPGEGRFCMDCGASMAGAPIARQLDDHASSAPSQDQGTDWATIVAAVLAFLSLRHVSRKARGTAIVIAFFVLFFGCPLVCGFVMFAMDWFAQLIR